MYKIGFICPYYVRTIYIGISSITLFYPWICNVVPIMVFKIMKYYIGTIY